MDSLSLFFKFFHTGQKGILLTVLNLHMVMWHEAQKRKASGMWLSRTSPPGAHSFSDHEETDCPSHGNQHRALGATSEDTRKKMANALTRNASCSYYPQCLML